MSKNSNRLKKKSKPLETDISEVSESSNSNGNEQEEIPFHSETNLSSESSVENNGFSFNSLEEVRKKLLDLSNRNPLLNYRFPKVGCVRLIDELPDQIFEILSEKKKFQFIPVKEPTEKELIEYGFLEIGPEPLYEKIELKELPTINEWAKLKYGLNTSFEMPEPSKEEEEKGKHQDTDLQTLLYPPNLESRLRTLRRNAETAIKDSGTNILFLNLGFLEWYESSDSDVPHLAPLFAIPAQLEQSKYDSKGGVYYYKINIKDDNLITNITLKEKLSNDFSLDLPEIEDDTKPEEYFSLIQEKIISNKPRWKIKRQASLVKLNFRKQVMYEDLDPEKWPKEKGLDKNKNLQLFFGGSNNEGGPESSGFLEEHDIDSMEEIHSKFPIVFDADSSQHSALIDAVNGGNLVIEGPPGTGKSQTIANLIAAELSNGKKILFVTDKMAALEVVKNRLDKKGLGDLCLELHSHKTDKKGMLDELMSRHKRLGNTTHPDEIRSDIGRFENLKEDLNNYAKLINSKYKNTDESINKILNKATRLRENFDVNPDELLIEGISGAEMTVMARDNLIGKAKILKDVFEQASEQAPDNKIFNHYWYGINNTEIKEFESNSLIELLNKWTNNLVELNKFWKKQLNDLEFGVDSNYQINNIEKLCESIGKLPEINGKEAFSEIDNLKQNLAGFESFINTFESIHTDLDELCITFEQKSVNDPKVLVELEKITKFFDQIGIESKTKVSELVQINSEIDNSIKLADKIEKHFETIKSNLPDAIKNHVELTKDGIHEFDKTISLIQQLDFKIWKDRDDIYDNSDLDDLLPKISKELSWIKPLQEELHDHFRLHKIPERDELLVAQEAIDNSGIFAWFSSDWRKAKKLILSLSATPKPNKKKLFNLLPKLIKFSKGISEIDKIHQSNPILGELYRGADTPIDEICIPLRNWYKSIREEYGFGFGDKVDFGNAIVNMDRPKAEALVEYDIRNLSTIRKEFLENISSITGIIPGYKWLNDAKTKLSGDDSPLIKLNKNLSACITSLSKVLRESNTTIEKINESQKLMGKIHSSIEKWTQLEIHKMLVPETFPFSTQAGANRNEHIVAAKKTLEIFGIANKTPAILRALSSKKDSSRYQDLKNSFLGLKEKIDLEKESKEKFVEAGNVEISEWTQASQNKIDDLIQKNELAIEKPLWLSTWLQYLDVKAKLSENGLDKILERLEEKRIDSSNLIELVELVIYHQLAVEITSKHDSIKGFNGLFQTGLIKQFKECDQSLLELQCRKISYNCSLGEPPAGIQSPSPSKLTELMLLMHEAGLKRKRTSVRGLVDRAGNAILSLKPCFMMSPMSVAQYLTPGKFEFDLIIMDEASQIRPADSLGSIARGKRFVCVGDPKQLPPTMFFSKLVNEDDQDEDTVTLELTDSILDAAIPMFKKRRLRWHYRSRHESLIAFSNQEFYDSDLVIFPSPFQQNKNFGVKYNPVKGRFSNRRNRAEAAAIARNAAKHMLENPEESVGIVAMNSEQREEIEMHFEQITKENELFRNAYTENQNLDEPLFIKNLENVQGDERDVIMISMTYGPDPASGRTMQRFGPINSDVGWRRLNVLFTRAKNRMQIYSSMGSSDIIVSGTSKKGVISLKSFLEYCETGHLNQPKSTGKPPDSDFEIAVIKAMEKRGYECEPQLGVAGYFLDIAVKDPKNPSRYLMGIECDGATYHSAKSARDRDRLRQEVLEGLGWEIHRIWSTDWFKNPEAQLEPILKRLEKLTIKSSEEDLSVEKVKDEVIYFPDSEVTDQISFFEKEPSQRKKPSKKSILIEESSTEELTKPEFGKKVQSNDFELSKELENFNTEEIKIKFPNTKHDQCLLRPKMIDELVKNRPTTRDEFREMIPQYLRSSTLGQEFKVYIDSVLEIIGEY